MYLHLNIDLTRIAAPLRTLTWQLIVACAGWLFFSSFAQAENKLPPQPITIEADQAVIDEKKGLSIYTGNVVLIQGANKFLASELTVYTLDGQVEKVFAQGKPIKFSQRSDSEKADITGEANKLEYYAREQRLLLLEDAKLAQGPNQFSGDKIEYDTLRQVVTAHAAESGKQRVKVIIEPQQIDSKESPEVVNKP